MEDQGENFEYVDQEYEPVPTNRNMHFSIFSTIRNYDVVVEFVFRIENMRQWSYSYLMHYRMKKKSHSNAHQHIPNVISLDLSNYKQIQI